MLFSMRETLAEWEKAPARLLSLLDKMIKNRIFSLRKQAGGRHEKAMEIWFGNR